MFGGPIDLTPFGGWVKGIGVLYWVLAAAGLWWALHGDRPRGDKVLRAIPVLLVFGFWPVKALWTGIAANQRLTLAQAHFDMRCKSAGEKIHRTVDNVDGVVWMKWRPRQADVDSQFSSDDVYGRNCGGEDCILLMLRLDDAAGRFASEVQKRRGRYLFVESQDPSDGMKYRYTGVMKPTPAWAPSPASHADQDIPASAYRFALNRKPIDVFTARYGVTWDDISTREDRELWIAGGALRIADLQDNRNVIAERIGYMMDRGLGSRAGGRSPWLYAEFSSCPSFERSGDGFSKWSQTTGFVFKVLKPTMN